jgi:hypothetical protein
MAATTMGRILNLLISTIARLEPEGTNAPNARKRTEASRELMPFTVMKR